MKDEVPGIFSSQNKVLTETERGSAADSIESVHFHRGVSRARFARRASRRLLRACVPETMNRTRWELRSR